MKLNNELIIQFSELMHEIMITNKEIVSSGKYRNLLSLCEQDITILTMVHANVSITAKEISNQLGVPKTTIVSGVSRLVRRGYIERKPNENDKRELFLELTGEGMKAHQEHIEFEKIFLESLVCRWSEADQKELAELLRRRSGLHETFL